jgi:hypothetical protein
MNETVLASKRNRSLVGLSGAIPVAIVAVLFFEGVLLWLALALAAADVVFVPYVLGRIVEQH